MRFIGLLMLVSTLLLNGGLMARPLLSVETEKIDFGKVPQKTWFFHKVILRANNDGPIAIKEVNTFCECILLPVSGQTLKAGDSLVVELAFYSGAQVGHKEWRPHIYFNGKKDKIYVRVMADIVPEIERYRPIYVMPHSVAASQFMDNTKREFPLQIINASAENVPLELIYTDNEFFDVDFPVYVPPNDTAFGKVILNDKGLKSEFNKTIIFEFIDSKSKRHSYSIPVRRKIFKGAE